MILMRFYIGFYLDLSVITCYNKLCGLGREHFALDRRPLNNLIGGSTQMIERDEYQVPADAIEALARRLLPAIRSYFESEEGKAAFSEWKSRQNAEALSEPAQEKRAG
jgi:hypothetical protein